MPDMSLAETEEDVGHGNTCPTYEAENSFLLLPPTEGGWGGEYKKGRIPYSIAPP
jgi:hypothetical protein